MLRHVRTVLACFGVLVCLLAIVPSVLAIQNAVNQDTSPQKCNVRFARATIDWTNPNLNTNFGGTYNRTGITTSTVANPSQPASQFVEIGWNKEIILLGLVTREFILVQYTDINGMVQRVAVNRPQRSVHEVTAQFDPRNTQQWFFFENGQLIVNQGYTSNFNKGCVAVAGGEVATNVEDMGNTRFYNLTRGRVNANGIITQVPWKTNARRLYQGRYSCTVTTVTDHRCGP